MPHEADEIPEKTGETCPHCQRPLRAEKPFCAACGAHIGPEEPALFCAAHRQREKAWWFRLLGVILLLLTPVCAVLYAQHVTVGRDLGLPGNIPLWGLGVLLALHVYCWQVRWQRSGFCPACRGPIRLTVYMHEHTAFCYHCGTRVLPSWGQRNAPEDVRDPQSARDCAFCGEKGDWMDRYCTACGAHLQRAATIHLQGEMLKAPPDAVSEFINRLGRFLLYGCATSYLFLIGFAILIAVIIAALQSIFPSLPVAPSQSTVGTILVILAIEAWAAIVWWRSRRVRPKTSGAFCSSCGRDLFDLVRQEREPRYCPLCGVALAPIVRAGP